MNSQNIEKFALFWYNNIQWVVIATRKAATLTASHYINLRVFYERGKTMYTVYKHTCPNGKVYIGITSMGVKRRWKGGSGYIRNLYFYRAIKKYGWNNITHEILFEGLEKSEAEQREVELIAEYKSNQSEFGYNISNGGESIGKHSAKTIEKQSRVHRRENLTAETIEKMRQAKLGKKQSAKSIEKRRQAILGSKHSEETKEKIRQAHLGMKYTEETKEKLRQGPSCKRVLCVETGRIYTSISEAGRELMIDKACISRVVNGNQKKAGGFHWKYAV